MPIELTAALFCSVESSEHEDERSRLVIGQLLEGEGLGDTSPNNRVVVRKNCVCAPHVASSRRVASYGAGDIGKRGFSSGR